MKNKILFLMAFMLILGFGMKAQVFITEIADPNNEAGARFVELYNAGSSSVDFSTGWQINRYTNGNASPQTPVDLTGTIAAGGFYIICANQSTFTSTYGFAADQNIGTGGPADSNGDDQIFLLSPGSIIVDFFGVAGEDGSNTCHEFEDGRAERVASVTAGVQTWNEAEWNVWSDGSSASGCTNHISNSPQDAPDNFDPGQWIGVVNTNDQTSTVVNPSVQVSANTISSLEADSVPVLRFDITDAGTADGLPTIVTGIYLVAGANNTINFEDNLSGGGVYDLTNSVVIPLTGQPIVNADNAYLPISFSIPDNSTVSLELFAYIENNDVPDNGVLQFQINAASNGFTTDAAGSSFEDPFAGGNIVGNNFTLNVVATQLSFVTQPSNVVENNVMSPAVQVGTTDVYGNVDVNYAATSITLATSTGTMTGANPVNTTAGLATFSDLTFSPQNINVTLNATGGTFSGITSNTFDVTEPFIVSKLLITEIAVTPTAGEFVEIYNPGSSTVNLSDYYITDATYAGGGNYYYNIVLGANYGGGGFGDFHARFPDGATINAGEVQTIALNGSDNFFTTYSVNCTYELYEDAGTPDGIPDMREAIAGSINNQGAFTNSGEVCILYAWDGSSDLVTDVDYFMWGDNAEAVDKTGVTINSSTYNNDTPLANQEFMTQTHASGDSWQRIDMSEGTQTTSGSNGVNGRDETSENITVTWGTTAVTPNTIPAPPSPTITITSPTEGSTETSADVDIVFNVENFVVGDNSGGSDDGHIHYTVDGGSTVMYYTTNPIALTGLSNGNHTVITWLVDNAHQPLIPNVADTVHFTVSVVTNGGATCSAAVPVNVGTHHAIHPQGGGGAYDQWYVFTAPTNGTITVSDCGLTTVDTDVEIIEDNCGGTNFDNADDNCSTSQETLDFNVVAGINYYIGWGNYEAIGAEHDWTLSFTPAPPPINIVNAYSINNDSLVVFYESGLTSVNPADYTLTATGQTTVNFTQASIDATYDSIVYLKAQNNFTLNTIRDNLNDVANSTTYQFYAGVLPISFTNTANHPDTVRQGYNFTVSGIVTADDEYNQVWIQDSNDAMHGLLIADNGLGDNVNVGDSITVAGQKTFYFGMTELENPTLISINSGYTEVPAIVNSINLNYSLAQDDVNAEPWEGQLVTVENIVIDSLDSQNHYEYFGHDCDGNVLCFNDDVDYHYGSGFALTNGTMYNLTGVVTFSFGKYKVNPRGIADAVEVARDMTSLIEDPDNQVITQTINCNNVADSINAIEVFKFKITDEGTDGLPTALSQMTFYTGANNTLPVDGFGINGAWFDFGDALNPIQFLSEPVITGNKIVYEVDPATAIVDNGTSREIILHVWFDPAYITDGDILQLETHANSHGFISGCMNSQFSSAFTSNVTGGEITISKPDAISRITENKINIYPNPANNKLFVENMKNVSSVSFVNVLGKVVKTVSVFGENAELNINNLTNGMYFLEFINTNGSKSIKTFIKN